MEYYTDSNSDFSSDSENKIGTVDLAYLLLKPVEVEKTLQDRIDGRKNEYLETENLILHHNQLTVLPKNVLKFPNLKVLDISNNGLTVLPNVFEYCSLSKLIAKNNLLTNESLPKKFSECEALKELNLSGNQMNYFPEQICDLTSLKFLHLGGNKIKNITRNIYKLKNIQVLSFGGNQISEVPAIVGHLKTLQVLILCDNQIETLPANIANLKHLKSLQLHKNRLKVLPPEIIALKNLNELSLRENPLVVRFISDMAHTSATLLELAARIIKLHEITVQRGEIPDTLIEYLNSAHHCVNPNCKGVYFNNRVEHIKFVDFCGKYRIPLLQYLCSSKCRHDNKEEDVRPLRSYMMKKVLLG